MPRTKLGAAPGSSVARITRATSLAEGTVVQAIKEVRDQIIEFCRAGRAVKVDGLGTFTPTIVLEGYFAISFRADSALNYGLNVPGTFTGTILNCANIGRWNLEHADHQVEFSEN